MSKDARQQLEQAIHRHAADDGVQAIRNWILERMDYINGQWPSAAGEELLQYQGDARTLRRLLKVIEAGPTIKDITPRGE